MEPAKDWMRNNVSEPLDRACAGSFPRIPIGSQRRNRAPAGPRFRALALLGRPSWERVDGFVTQTSEKPAQEQTFSLSNSTLDNQLGRQALHHLVPRVPGRLRTVAIPRSGLDREGLISKTSLSTCRVSPGRVGFGHFSSPIRRSRTPRRPGNLHRGEVIHVYR